MENIPVVMLQGPRMVGKSTLLREMARPTGNAVLDLDSPMVMEESPFDTERFLSAPKPFFVDEHQKDPYIPQHIKAVLNRDGSNGRFVLTCSVRRETPFSGIKPLTGRLYSLPVAPLAQAEIAGVPGNFLSAAFEDVESLIPGVSVTTREQYIDKMLTGGFPMALAARDEDDRALWFAHYVRTAITEDARSLVRFHQADRLYRLLRRLAAQTGQALNIAKAASEADLGERTALNHARLLEDIFMLELLPAWTKTDTGPTGRPKVYVVDSGVAARFPRSDRGETAEPRPLFCTAVRAVGEDFCGGGDSQNGLLAERCFQDGLLAGSERGGGRLGGGTPAGRVGDRDGNQGRPAGRGRSYQGAGRVAGGGGGSVSGRAVAQHGGARPPPGRWNIRDAHGPAVA